MTGLVRRVEVVWPDGRHVISLDPLFVAERRYPDHQQFVVREVWGVDLPDGSGFCVRAWKEPAS